MTNVPQVPGSTSKLRSDGAQADLERLRGLPRVQLGRWPTPIDRRDKQGRELLIKRDDLCGHGRGGAKARKIEHFIGYLLEQGHDELIAVVGNVTNLAFDMVPVLERHRLRARLLVGNEPKVAPADRERIFQGVRQHIELLEGSRWQVARTALSAYRQGRRQGRRPFLLLPGASHPASLLGNAAGFLEMVEQRRAAGEPLPGTVFVTVATGTTLGGFLLAEAALRAAGSPPIRIIGVQAHPGSPRLWAAALIQWTRRKLGLRCRVPLSRIQVETREVNGPLGEFTRELAELCERVRAEVGIEIDPIFGGKTWAVMEALWSSLPEDGRPILYWHCGHTPDWRTLGQIVDRGRRAPA